MHHNRAAVAQDVSRTNGDSKLGLLLIDASLLTLLFVAPLFLGGRHPLGNTVYLALALPACFGLLLCTASGMKLSLPTPVWIVLAGAFCLPILQVVPLGTPFTELVSPGIRRFAELEEAPLVPAQIGDTLSIAAEQTRRSIPNIVLYVAIFLCVCMRTREVADARRILALIAASGGVLAVVALLQVQFGNGLFVWIYDHPTRDPGSVPRGPFQNENHLCNLLAMAMPCLLCLAYARPRRPSRHASNSERAPVRGFSIKRHLAACSAAIAAIVILCTIAATPSRGGKAIVAITIAVFLGLIIFRQLAARIGSKNLSSWFLGGWIVAASGLAVGVLWMSANIEELSYWRMKIWLADLRIWREFPLSGVGLGNHRYIYRAYLGEYFEQTFSTSESSWMQVLVEGGLAGIALQTVAVLIVAGTLTRTLAKKLPIDRVLILTAISAALAGSCLHAFIDFTWHIPACTVPSILLAGLAIRFPRLTSGRSPSERGGTLTLPPSFCRLLPVLLIFALLSFLPQGISEARSEIAWDQYRRLMRSSDADAQQSAQQSAQAIGILQRSAALDPANTRARSALIRHLLARWHSSALDPDAAQLSRHILQHCQALAQIAPTQGEHLFFAAVVAPSIGLTTDDQRSLLQRAYLCRRSDGRIAAQCAILEMLEGNRAAAVSLWRKAIEYDRGYTEHGLRTLISLFPLPTLIAELHPSRRTTEVLIRLTEETASPAEKKLLARHMSQCLAADAMETEHHAEAVQFMKTAAEYAELSGDLETRVAIAQQRVALQQSNIATQMELVQLLMESSNLRAAREQLESCRRIAPNDTRVRQASVDLLKRESGMRMHRR